MSAHTPAPWFHDDGIVYPEDDHNGQAWIADLRGAVDAEANARLIEAAPDLLAALQGLLDPATNEDGEWYRSARKAAVAAIAKATGSQP